MEKKKTVLYASIVSAIVFAVHFIITIFLKKAVKYAVFSKTVGITAAFIAVGAVMLILYFWGRKLIISKTVIPLKCYFVISAVIPPVIWFAVTVIKCASFIGSTDFNAIISEPNLRDIISSAMGLIGTVNSFISFFSSAMIFLIAGIFELIDFLIKTLRKRVEKN